MADAEVRGQLNRISPGARKIDLGKRMGDLVTTQRSMLDLLLNVALSSGGLTIGTSSKKAVKIASTFYFLVDGVPYAKAGAEVGFTATTHDIAPSSDAAQERFYLLSLVSGGTVTITAGVQGAAGAGTRPATPAGGTPFGLVKITVASGSTPFDATSDDLDAAHLTVVYMNLVGVPNPADMLAVQTDQPAAI